ncbi:hypothetical protein [Limisphaera sp. 4302-co]|uniref:hypothetical protein n=1 Tax=Limisphaera sp. 4302-co TaxID=3400417 RepID=UPI003C16B809
MTRVLQAPWMAALVGGLLYLGVTTALLTQVRFVAPGGTTPATALRKPRPADDLPSWRFRNPELNQWIAELQREREALALRREQLKELEVRLEAERQELSVITQTVARLQAEFDRNIVRLQESQAEQFKRQAKLLTGMSLDGQLALLAEMADDDVVRLFALMKNDDVSQLLDAMSKAGPAEARRALLIIEKMRRLLPPDTNKVAVVRSP